MRKLLLASLLSLALAAQASAASVTLNWTAAAPVAPNPTDITGYQIWDLTSAGGPPLNAQIGSVGPTVTTFTTGTLTAGSSHQFTVVAVYGEGSAVPSNTFAATIPATTTLAPATNLTGVINP
jgi:hypothetical protein